MNHLRANNIKMPYNLSNNKIKEYVISFIKSDIETKSIKIAAKLRYVNLKETLDSILSLLVENNLIDINNPKLIRFNRNINLVKKESNKVKITSEFYSLLLIERFWTNYCKELKIELNHELYFKIRQDRVFHNIHIFQDEVLKKVILSMNVSIKSKPIIEQIELLDNIIEKTENFDYLNDQKVYEKHIKFLSDKRDKLLQNTPIHLEKKEQLPISKVWLTEPKITQERVIQKGINLGLWDENRNLTSNRGSLYSSGKNLLASLSIALKGHAISSSMDYKIIGEAFCETFNVNINQNTKEPYKPFCKGNSKIIRQFKQQFNLI